VCTCFSFWCLVYKVSGYQHTETTHDCFTKRLNKNDAGELIILIGVEVVGVGEILTLNLELWKIADSDIVKAKNICATAGKRKGKRNFPDPVGPATLPCP
jgi:hypothetical protein